MMRVREWTIAKPQPHRIAVEFGGLLDKFSARILLDDNEIHREPRRWLPDFTGGGFEHRFELDGLPCIVRVLRRFTHFEYELWLDGKLQ